MRKIKFLYIPEGFRRLSLIIGVVAGVSTLGVLIEDIPNKKEVYSLFCFDMHQAEIKNCLSQCRSDNAAVNEYAPSCNDKCRYQFEISADACSAEYKISTAIILAVFLSLCAGILSVILFQIMTYIIIWVVKGFKSGQKDN